MNWPKFFRYQKWRGTKRIVVNPITAIDLDHRADFMCAGPPGVDFVTASATGHISLIRDGLVLPSPPKFQHIYDLSAHRANPWLFVADGVDGSIKVVGLSGEQIAELAGVPIDEQRDHRIPFGLTACCFDARRGLLWCAGAVSDSLSNIRIFESGSWRLLCETSIADPFGESHLAFYPSPDFTIMPLYLAAGQDGQQVFWLTWDGSDLNVSPQPELLETIPMFSPSNEWYLAMESGGIMRCNYPEGETLRYRSQFWSDEQGTGWLECLDDRYALASTGEGIIYLLDAIPLRIIAEVIVAGHEPRPAEELYPTLGPNKDLCTHLGWFIRIGSTVVITECRNDNYLTTGWEDRVIVLSVDDLQR